MHNIEVRFNEYTRSVDGVTSRATEHLRQLEREANLNTVRSSNLDPLTRDIELLRARREYSLKAEGILSHVKQDVQRERLNERFDFVRKILTHNTPIYDEQKAGIAYKSLVSDLSTLIRNKPGLGNLEVVRDPMLGPIGPTFQNPQLTPPPPVPNNQLNTTLNPGNTSIPPYPPLPLLPPQQPIDQTGAIMHQNFSMVDHSTFSRPRIKLEKNLLTSHKGEITAVISLNPRYLITAGSDKTVCLWDTTASMQLLFASQPFDAEVCIFRKLTVDPSHFLGNVVIAVKRCKSAANIGAFNFCSVVDMTTPASLLWSNSIADQVTALEILSREFILAAYEGGILCALHSGSLEVAYRAETKTRIDALLVLPDSQTVILASDNEYTILDFPHNLQVTTRRKRRDTAAFGSLRCVGRNSEVFAGFLKNGLVKIYRASDGECLNVILGQRAEYESAFILNFFSTDPNIYVFALSRFKPNFFYCNLDDSEMLPIDVADSRFAKARGDPSMQIVDLVPGSHMTFVTVANEEDKPPGLYLWKLTFHAN